MSKNVIPLLVLLLVVCPAGAEDIYDFPETFTVKTFIEAPGMNLDFKGIASNRKVQWKPNTRGNVGLGVSVAGIIGGSVSAKGSLTREDRIARGDTNYQDWRFFLNYSWIQILLNYQEYYGFYIENSAEIDPTYANSPNKIQEPRMTARNYSVNSTYVWSPERFSL
ncbi:MAG: DUF4421 family protein, partial [Bdellovibrionia bacterium]